MGWESILGGILGGAGGVFGGIQGNRQLREQKKLADTRHRYALEEMDQQRQGFEEEFQSSQQAAEQSLFARGIGQSSIADQTLGRRNAARIRYIASLQRKQDLANQGYEAFKKSLKNQEIGNWVKAGFGALTAGIGALKLGGAFDKPKSSGTDLGALYGGYPPQMSTYRFSR